MTTDREIPRISLKDFDARREEIKEQLVQAAETVGFFALYEQERPTPADIDKMFKYSQKFFALDSETKMKTPFQKLYNTGYECKAQIRPSTGTPDNKESLQLQYHRINQNWPAVEDVGEDWKEFTAKFIEDCNYISAKVLSVFSEALGFDPDFLVKAHNIYEPTAQSTLRLLHYQDVSKEPVTEDAWRVGPHTDFDCLTFLFQRTGDHGLEVCPGREAHHDFAYGDDWTPVPSHTGEIVINIGDMLMAWSDDRFKSNFHRVRVPPPSEDQTDRYTIGWFNQANTDVVIQGPKKKYPATTGRSYIEDSMKRNYSRVNEILKMKEDYGTKEEEIACK